MRFYGTIDELKQEIATLALNGDWLEEPNKVWRFRIKFGANLHWASTSKKIWFDGPKPVRDELERIATQALDACRLNLRD